MATQGDGNEIMERARAYAEACLEDVVMPGQAELRNLCETPGQAERAELAITADMEWLKARLMMAYQVGWGAAEEESRRPRRSRK